MITNKFKVGDKVLIKKSSRFYCQAKGIVGDIVEAGGGWVIVNFVNGYKNGYPYEDIKLVINKPLPNLNHKIIEIMKGKNSLCTERESVI